MARCGRGGSRRAHPVGGFLLWVVFGIRVKPLALRRDLTRTVTMTMVVKK